MVRPAMSKRDKEQPSELATAAEALETELRRFEDFSEQFQKHPLNTEKNLERASRLLQEVAALDERLRTRVSDLVAAITKARDRQGKQAESIQQHALVLEQRVEVFKQLLTRYGALGQSAAELNAQVQQFAARRSEARTPEQSAHLAVDLQALLERMGQLATEAQSVAEAANAQDFSDVARQADGLRQQLQAARNKLSLLTKELPEA
jgi:chromosome segregation ATPase